MSAYNFSICGYSVNWTHNLGRVKCHALPITGKRSTVNHLNFWHEAWRSKWYIRAKGNQDWKHWNDMPGLSCVHSLSPWPTDLSKLRCEYVCISEWDVTFLMLGTRFYDVSFNTIHLLVCLQGDWPCLLDKVPRPGGRPAGSINWWYAMYTHHCICSHYDVNKDWIKHWLCTLLQCSK